MKIQLDTLTILHHVFKVVPMRTPSRIEVIKTFVTNLFQESSTNLNSKYVLIDIQGELHYQEREFSFCANDIMLLEQTLNMSNSPLVLSNMPVVLIPQRNFCCDRILSLQSYYATVTHYTLQNICDARSYHSKCKSCGTAYHFGFSEDKAGIKIFLSCINFLLGKTLFD